MKLLTALLILVLYSPSAAISFFVVDGATDGIDTDLQSEINPTINKTININNYDVLKVQILANSLEKRIKTSGALLEITARLPEIRVMPNSSLLNETLATLNGLTNDVDMERRTIAQNIILNQNNDISAIGFIMPNGDVYFIEPYSRQENLTTHNLAFRDYYKGVLNSSKTYLEILNSASSSNRQIDIAVPVLSDNNRLIGLWVGAINVGVLDQELRSIILPEGQRILYVDSNGNKIAGSDNNLVPNVKESFSNLMSFRRAIEGESGSVIEKLNGQQLLISYSPVEAFNDRWAILWMQPISKSVTGTGFKLGG